MASRDVVVTVSEGEVQATLAGLREAIEEGMTAFNRALQLTATLEANDGWRLLGYRSLAACIAAEVGLTRQRAYQIIDEMKGQKLVARPKTGLVGGPAAKHDRSAPVTRVDREHIEEYDEAVQVTDDEYSQVGPDDEDYPQTDGEEFRAPARSRRSEVQAVLDAATLIVDADQSVLDAITMEQRREFQFTFIEARNRLDALIGTP